MERIGKRLLSLTLAVLLLVTLLPAQAIAAELESLAENRNASGTFVDVPEGACAVVCRDKEGNYMGASAMVFEGPSMQ